MRSPEQKSNILQSSQGEMRDRINVLLMCSHVPERDPRIGWMSDVTDKNFCFNVLGLGHEKQYIGDTFTGGKIWLTIKSNNRHLRSLQLRRRLTQGSLVLSMIHALTQETDSNLVEILGIPENSERIPFFRWHLNYVYDTSVSLLMAAIAVKGLDLLIAVDLEVLPGAILLGDVLNIPVIMDAHEYWPDSDRFSEPWEKRFWTELQRLLVPRLAAVSTVSPYLATLYNHNYVFTIPNATTYIPKIPRPIHQTGNDLIFLFQGIFAPGRGLKSLIRNWKGLPESAKLHLRGPYNDYVLECKRYARDLGLLDTTVFFVEPVHESELIPKAAEAHVGIIPYEPYCATYSNCSPNKLSQYLAAGLPIVSNKLEYINTIIDENGLGFCADFEDIVAFQKVILGLLHDRTQVESLSMKARKYFEDVYHWEKISEPIYKFMTELGSRSKSITQRELVIDMQLVEEELANVETIEVPESCQFHTYQRDIFSRLDSVNSSYITLLRYVVLRTLGGMKRKMKCLIPNL